MSDPDAHFPPLARTRILFVSSSDEECGFIAGILQRQGHLVDCRRVADRDAMLEALRQDHWDAIIAEQRLPGPLGNEALRALRASGVILPLIIVTRSAGEELAVNAMRAGADDVLHRGRLGRLGRALTNAMRAGQARLDRQRAEAALRASEQRLRALSGHLQNAIEEERRAIAREIHDEIGGALTALRYDLAWIDRHADDALRQRATQAIETLTAAQQASQRLVRDLRPPVLDAGIVAALQWQLDMFRKRTGAGGRLRSNKDDISLTEETSMTVYRTLQEALTNVVKHAGATRVNVDLIARDGMLSLEIADDGRGVADSDLAKPDSYGLRGLAERARAVGGWIEVSGAARGTVVLLTVPLQPVASRLFATSESESESA
jgi:signal transduction histidine kinase